MPVSTLTTPCGTFRIAIDGPANAPVLVLSNSLGTTLQMWDAQAAHFAQTHRVLRYDTRGHGGSVCNPGPYSFAQLGQDVLAILDALHIEQAHFCGISMGGLTGLWLGVNAPARMRSITVANSAAKIGVESAWIERAAMVRAQGTAAMQALGSAISGITVPTLLIAGEHDPVTTVADAQAMHAAIAASVLATVPASHLSNLEAPSAFEQALAGFLKQH